jgi:acylphosphatase
MTSGSSASAPADRARLEAVVSGVVQGVGFRSFVVTAATRLRLVGWVANLPDGRVQCVAEGPRADLEALAEALHDGPAGALVSNLSLTWMPPLEGFQGFAIRSAGHRGD